MKKYLAIVAPIGAGKTTVANYFVDKGFSLYKLSFAIYDEARERGLDKEDRTTLQDIGDEMRKEGGYDILAKKAIENIKNNEEHNYVIDSIRNHHELMCLKDYFKDELLILAIDADIDIRYDRVVKRQGQYKEQNLTFEEFEKINKRDIGLNNKPNEQNVAKCLELAEKIIQNNKDEKYLIEQIDTIYNKYFK